MPSRERALLGYSFHRLPIHDLHHVGTPRSSLLSPSIIHRRPRNIPLFNTALSLAIKKVINKSIPSCSMRLATSWQSEATRTAVAHDGRRPWFMKASGRYIFSNLTRHCSKTEKGEENWPKLNAVSPFSSLGCGWLMQFTAERHRSIQLSFPSFCSCTGSPTFSSPNAQSIFWSIEKEQRSRRRYVVKLGTCTRWWLNKHISSSFAGALLPGFFLGRGEKDCRRLFYIARLKRKHTLLIAPHALEDHDTVILPCVVRGGFLLLVR